MQLTVPEASNNTVLHILALGEADLLKNWLKHTPDSTRVAEVVDARANAEINHFAVLGQIIDRYSAIISFALESMDGMFTYSEVVRMANVNPSSYWVDNDIASMLVDDLGGLEMVTQSSPEIVNLANKLCQLSVPQRIALVDVIEMVLRGMGKGESDDCSTLDELIQASGLVLKQMD